ncbi:MAG: AAA family ATPase [Clostridia bacterium]|nr:AAA family ATPase [Clostridia bacterium]
MMIKILRVKIENFQSHENSILEFTDGLNVIIGPSDQGKSAVVRAIKWVFYNEPRGMEFIRHGTSAARVTVELSNGYTIIRERSQRVNRYVVIDPQKGSITLEGFGNEVPQEVVRAHGIPKVMLDTDKSSSLNISEQLEGPFLLSESGAIRAKAIGRLTGLHIMDRAMKDTMTDLRRENQTSDRLIREMKEVDQSLEEFKDLPLLERKINNLDWITQNLERSISKKDKLNRLQNSINTFKKEYTDVKSTLEKLQGLEACEGYVRESDVLLKKIIQLKDSQKSLNEVQSGIEESRNSLEKTSKIHSLAEVIAEISEKKVRFERIEAVRSLLLKTEDEQKNVKRVLEQTEKLDLMDGMINRAEEKVLLEGGLISRNVKVKDLDAKINEANRILQKTAQVTDCSRYISEGDQKTLDLKKLEVLNENYKSLQGNIEEGKRFIEQNAEEMRRFVKAYTDLLKEAGKCPTCGGELSDDKLGEIIKTYEEAN